MIFKLAQRAVALHNCGSHCFWTWVSVGDDDGGSVVKKLVDL